MPLTSIVFIVGLNDPGATPSASVIARTTDSNSSWAFSMASDRTVLSRIFASSFVEYTMSGCSVAFELIRFCSFTFGQREIRHQGLVRRALPPSPEGRNQTDKSI